MIQEISITNFKSIKDLTISLRPVNVLIGPNGAGKSNFVNFFAFVYAIYDGRLAIYTSEKGGADRILHLGRRYSDNLSGFINFDNTNHYKFGLGVNEQNGFFFITEIEGYNPKRYDYNPGDWTWEYYGQGHTESNLSRELMPLRSGHVKKYLESFRVYHFHDTSKNAPLKQTARLLDNQFLRSDGENLPAFLYRLQQESSLAFNRIEATIRQIAPFFDRFELVPTGEYIRLNWRQKNTDMYLDASDFSDGTLRFIALCTLLLQPEPPKTIIIDEPELGLHPYAITILAGLIRSISAKTQVIVSTQSVNFVDQFEPEDIIVVENIRNESGFKRQNSDTLEAWLSDYSIGELWSKNVLGGNP